MNHFQAYILATANVLHNMFWFGLILHVCGQVDVLGQELRKIGGPDYPLEHSHKMLALFVRRHCHLLELTKYIQDNLNVLVLVQFLISGFLITIIGRT